MIAAATKELAAHQTSAGSTVVQMSRQIGSDEDLSDMERAEPSKDYGQAHTGPADNSRAAAAVFSGSVGLHDAMRTAAGFFEALRVGVVDQYPMTPTGKARSSFRGEKQ